MGTIQQKGSLRAGSLIPLALLLVSALAKAELPVITQVEQIRRMSVEEAGLGYPVHFSGVVSYYNYTLADLFIQDSSAGIWVDPGLNKLDLRAGSLVEVMGRTRAGDFSPDIESAQIHKLGEAPLPPAKVVSSDELASGRQDCQRVQVEGVVRSAAPTSGGLTLNVSSGAFEFTVFVLGSQQTPRDLADARIRVRGVFAGLYTTSGSQFLGFQVLVPSWGMSKSSNSPGRICSPCRYDRFISYCVSLRKELLRIAYMFRAWCCINARDGTYSSGIAGKPYWCAPRNQRWFIQEISSTP